MDRILENYIKGFPFLKIEAPATVQRGILRMTDDDIRRYVSLYESFKGRTLKFVPASGAASRMFKDLFSARDAAASGKPFAAGDPGDIFMKEMERWPFYSPAMKQLSPARALSYVLDEPLMYGHRPKGLVHFHRYQSRVRTAFEEHLVEGALYAAGADGVARMHFTVSPEHKALFENLLEEVRPVYEQTFSVRYDISFSVQDPDTDIMAVNPDNTPFLKEDGSVLRRPAGHGALLKNLGAMDADIIILKNIDNVVRQELIGDTVLWKKVLCGKLLEVRGKVCSHLSGLRKVRDEGACPGPVCDEAAAFLNREFCIEVPRMPREELPGYLMRKLDRPVRVCGMVPNSGEPGGGPFICRDSDGSTSLQILEKAQINMEDGTSVKMLRESTHFNPVDIVCSIKDCRGLTFDLERFVDRTTGLISEKSYQGRPLKAQELPGLWNGSMSGWNTVFVETPLTTFNPVKTVFDLLRPEHCGQSGE